MYPDPALTNGWAGALLLALLIMAFGATVILATIMVITRSNT